MRSTHGAHRGWRCSAVVLALVAALLPARGVSAQSGTPLGFEVVGRSFTALQVRDDVSMAAWYARAFGLDELRHLEADDGSSVIRLLQGGGVIVEIIRAEGAEPPSGRWTHGLFKAGFWVDDIEAAHDRFVSLGQGTDSTIMVDDALRARAFVTRDPEGNRLQFFWSCDGDCSGPQRGPSW